MLVTEGQASKRGRYLYVAIAGLVLALAAVLLGCIPALVRPVLWVSLAFAAGTASRSLAFSVLARLAAVKAAPEVTARPSFAFLIPGLNELPSLRRTVPAMTSLRYDGRLLLCYVCESASTDGSAGFLRDWAARDDRIVLIEKATPPGGRGAAISYGLDHAPRTDVVGFLDADHILDQQSMDELVRQFGAADPPAALQGVCATLNERPNALARLLTIEREWLEIVELRINPLVGGIGLFGGGQGFFRRSLFDDPRLRIDDSMVLDDIDLSARLALEGHAVTFSPRVETRSYEPESLREFLDQRSRWGRGWVQLAPRYVLAALRWRGVPLAVRMDLLRVVLTPFAAAWLCVGFAAGLVALCSPAHAQAPVWLGLVGLGWPFALGFGPYLAGARSARLRDLPLSLIGVPFLFYTYCALIAASLVDAFLLRRPVRYAKTEKRA
jgi:cellulose synthase/poly-beta-1,6-N-acetylglucosamine synthase-like glycosyltransferase